MSMNLKNIEQAFYQFLNLIYQGRSHQQITSIILITYSLNLIFIFFASREYNQSIFNAIFTNGYIIIVGISILIMLILQLIIALVLKVQLLLYYQLMFYRYIVFPFLLLWLAFEIKQQEYLPQIATIILYTMTIFISLMIHCLIHSLTQKQILSQTKYTELTILSDALLISLKLIGSSSIYYALDLLILILVCLITGKKFRQSKIGGIQDKLLYLAEIIKEFICYVIVVKQMLYIQVNYIIFSSISFPFVVLFPFIIFLNKNKISLSSEIFLGKSSLVELYYFIDLISRQLLTYRQNLNLSIDKSIITTFLALHKQNCHDYSCVLLHNSTNEQLKRINQPQNIKVILFKLKKKIQQILDMYEKNHPSSIVLKLVMAKFYILHLPNNIKLSQLLAHLSLKKINLRQKALLSIYYQKVRKQQNQGRYNSTDLTQFTIFRKNMIEIIGYFRQFWSEICEQTININKLMTIISKLYPLKQDLQMMQRRMMKEETFVAWRILKLYITYKKVILHDDLHSIILQDYVKMKEKQLKEALQANYINQITSQSVISISLSQSSLGKIVSLNNQAAVTFGYMNKNRMLQLRVNDIMPNIFSIIHDSILTEFLKNRFKTINQDQRLLYGKNKSNYVFPLKLQLRKMSWNNNDQLIFIANIQTLRTNKAPLFCICDLQGDVQDYTSNFKWMFMKKYKRNKQQKNINIQEVIPNFFVFIQQQGLSQVKKKLDSIKKVKKYDYYINIQFTAKQIIVKNQKIGYLVEGQQIQVIKSAKEVVTGKIAQNRTVKSKFYYPINFNHDRFQYQFMSQKISADNSNLVKSATLPYLKSDQLGSFLFLTRNSIVKYDKDIKTMRLSNNKIQYIGQEQQFVSDDQGQTMKNISLTFKVQQIKQELNVKDHKNNTLKNEILTIIGLNIILIMIIVIGLINLRQFNLKQEQFINNYSNQIQIKSMLCQILIYQYYQSNKNISYVYQMNKVIDNMNLYIYRSNLNQQEIEDIYKHIYDGYFRKYKNYQSNLLDFTYRQNINGLLHPENSWLTISPLMCIYAIGLIIMYLFYKKTIGGIYFIFTSIKEEIIFNYIKQCQNLLQSIYNDDDKSFTEDFNMKKLIEEKDSKLEQEIQRCKKVKNDFSYKDLIRLSKLVVPVIGLIVLSLYCSIEIIQQQNEILYLREQTLKTTQILPSASIFLMKNMFDTLKYGNVSFPSNFDQIVKNFEYQLLQGQQANSNLQILMRGDPCQNPEQFSKYNLNTTLFCKNDTVLLDMSLENVLNYMKTVLHSNSNKSSVDWDWLILLEYKLVKPLLAYNVQQTLLNYKNIREKQYNFFIICSCVLIMLIILVVIYLIKFPLTNLIQIAIIPSAKSSGSQTNNRLKQLLTLPNKDTIENM